VYPPEVAIEVRPAVPSDEPAIRHLLAHAPRVQVGAWPWEEHLGQEVFQVAFASGQLVGVLLAWPDGGPVAWVRLGALGSGIGTGPWLDRSLQPLRRPLRRLGARVLAWIDGGEWAGPALRPRGFWRLTRLVTMLKDTCWLPPAQAEGTQLRPATAADIPTLLRLDHTAFSPPWWFSAASLERLLRESSCFVVAERAGRCLGYAEARQVEYGAHLDRLAVAPEVQGAGVGAFLLGGTLSRLWEMGVEQVTLNTQEGNLASQRLYARLRFRPIGPRIGVWARAI
jgi:ribosomal-protein-alanine N-acetyltransferase